MKDSSVAKIMERTARALEEHAEMQVPGERVIKTLFTPVEEHGNVDAPGWCLKNARKLRQRANKVRKNFTHKERERNKPRYRS